MNLMDKQHLYVFPVYDMIQFILISQKKIILTIKSYISHQVVRFFNEAAQMSPEDADVHIVLGVLYNLSREYDKAIASFKTALQLKPQDYSLWNKLGATQANSVQSADAILAYRQVINWSWNINDDTFSVMHDS
jgi:Flp pilus assembly protein TadD